VSWGAVLAGAAIAAAMSLILLALGTGLGMSAISPWSYSDASATALGVGAIAWLLLMAAASSGLGGYVAGRLRPRWSAVPTDETFFRDTAHGLLAWCVATILSAAVLTSAATSMAGTAAKAIGSAAGGTVAAGVATAVASGPDNGANGYFTDMLFRGARTADTGADPRPQRAEVMNILATSLAQGTMTDGDKAYLSQLVAQRTGLSSAEADARVNQVVTAAKAAADALVAKAKATADDARRATLHAAMWVFVSLLLGAFSAALTATIGGRQRDAWATAVTV